MNPNQERRAPDEHDPKFVWDRLLLIMNECIKKIAALRKWDRVPSHLAHEEAWDLFIDCAQKFVRSPNGFMKAADPIGYLLESSRNLWMDRMESKKEMFRRQMGDLNEACTSLPEYDGCCTDILDLESGYQALESHLSKRDLSLLRMHAQGSSNMEIGEAHGLKPVSTRTALHKARHRALGVLKRNRLL